MVAEDASWNAALAERFYRQEFANRPVFLCVDEETLAAIGRDAGLLSDDAKALACVVRRRVRDRAPLDAWTHDAVVWRRSGFVGPPPFLSVLAVTVLAATTRGAATDRAYYTRLNGLLGLAGRGMPRDFDSDIQQLWLCLNDWLMDVEHGRRGLPTATNLVSAFPNIGWALSQTVLRPSDRAKLPILFNRLGVYPGQHVDGHLLVAGLRRSGLAGRLMSRRLLQVLDDPALAESLASTLASELAAWDGTLRDEVGRHAIPMLLTYHQRSRSFGVAVRTPADLAHLSVQLGREAPVALGEPGGLQLLPVPVTAGLLDGQSMLATLVALDERERVPSDIRLVMAQADVRVLTPNDDLARWVEVRATELRRRYLVLVRAGLIPRAVELMTSLGDVAPRQTSVSCPSGWMGYEFEPLCASSVDGQLSVLSPSGTEMVVLDGGLPILVQSRMYLTAGPPDVLLDLANSRAETAIDGEAVSEVDASGRVRLSHRGLAEGPHEVTAAGAHLTVRLVDEYAVGPLACTLGVAYRFETSPEGRHRTVPIDPGTGDIEDLGEGGGVVPDVVVQGASIGLSERARERTRPESSSFAQARAGGRHFALGDNLIAVRVFPQAPRWLLELHPRPVPHMVDLTSCSADLPFRPSWFLRISQDRASVVRADVLPPREGGSGTASTVNEWNAIVPRLAQATATPDQSDAWAAWLGSVSAPRPADVGGSS
jgi:hypothetical protein